MAQLNLEIITPEKIIYKDSVDSITVPGTKGMFQVLKDHAPLMSTIEIGVITFKKNDENKYLTVIEPNPGLVEQILEFTNNTFFRKFKNRIQIFVYTTDSYLETIYFKDCKIIGRGNYIVATPSNGLDYQVTEIDFNKIQEVSGNSLLQFIQDLTDSEGVYNYNNIENIKDYAQKYIDVGYEIAPFGPLSKQSIDADKFDIEKSYNKMYTANDFNEDNNIGIKTGKIINGNYFIIIDLDVYNDKINKIFDYLVDNLNLDNIIYEKTATNGRHLWILTNEIWPGRTVFKLENTNNDKDIIEVFGYKHFVAVYPSMVIGRDGIKRQYTIQGDYSNLPIIDNKKLVKILNKIKTKKF